MRDETFNSAAVCSTDSSKGSGIRSMVLGSLTSVPCDCSVISAADAAVSQRKLSELVVPRPTAPTKSKFSNRTLQPILTTAFSSPGGLCFGVPRNQFLTVAAEFVPRIGAASSNLPSLSAIAFPLCCKKKAGAKPLSLREKFGPGLARRFSGGATSP